MFDTEKLSDVNQSVTGNEVLTVTPTVTPTVTLEVPAKQTEIAKFYNTSKQSIGKWIKKIESELTKNGLDPKTLKDDDGITEFGLEQIHQYKSQGLTAYRTYVSELAKSTAKSNVSESSKALALLDDTSIASFDSDTNNISTVQSNKLTVLTRQCESDIDATMTQFMSDNADFFNSYLQSGIEIGRALGTKKAALTLQAMQNAETRVFNELVKKQSETLG